MTSLLRLLGKAFDPDQPRDEDGKWTNAAHATASQLGGATPDEPVRSGKFYHVTRKEHVPQIVKEGLSLKNVSPRWQNDYAVSLSRGLKPAVNFFSTRDGGLDTNKYAVLEVTLRGRMEPQGKGTGRYSSDAKDYTRQMLREGYDAADRGSVYVYNPRAIASVRVMSASELPQRKTKKVSLVSLVKAFNPNQPRATNGQWVAFTGEETARGLAALAATKEAEEGYRHFDPFDGEKATAKPPQVWLGDVGFAPGVVIVGNLPESGDKRYYSVEDVPLKDMRRSQSSVTRSGVEAKLTNQGHLGFENGDLPSVVREVDGGYRIISGHHRATASMLAGRQTMRANVIQALARPMKANGKPGKPAYKRRAQKTDLCALLCKQDGDGAGIYTTRQVGPFIIVVETKAGERRKGGSPDWPVLPNDYGYVLFSGVDGDSIDAHARQGATKEFNGPVFVVDQRNKEGGFDEHKLMLGWHDAITAALAYQAAYQPGWTGRMNTTRMTVDEFQDWVSSEWRKKPAHAWWLWQRLKRLQARRGEVFGSTH